MTHDDDKPLTPAQARQKLQKGLSDYLAGNDPGPIVFRLKRTKKASETYPLKLTQQQRETLLRCTHLSRGLKNKIEKAYLLADPEQKPLSVSQTQDGATVALPAEAPDKLDSVVVLSITSPAGVVLKPTP